jgi:hypothetical protein
LPISFEIFQSNLTGLTILRLFPLSFFVYKLNTFFMVFYL